MRARRQGAFHGLWAGEDRKLSHLMLEEHWVEFACGRVVDGPIPELGQSARTRHGGAARSLRGGMTLRTRQPIGGNDQD